MGQREQPRVLKDFGVSRPIWPDFPAQADHQYRGDGREDHEEHPATTVVLRVTENGTCGEHEEKGPIDQHAPCPLSQALSVQSLIARVRAVPSGQLRTAESASTLVFEVGAPSSAHSSISAIRHAVVQCCPSKSYKSRCTESGGLA